MYRGDFAPSSVIRRKFTTADPTGAPVTLAGSPAAKAYKDGSTSTEVTTGVTLTVDFDGVTGLHEIAVDTSSDGSFYAAGSDFFVILTAGTVNGVSRVGEVLLDFSLSARSALRPATAGRALVVDAAGLADANMVKSGPTGSGTAQTARDLGGTLGAAGAGLTAIPVVARVTLVDTATALTNAPTSGDLTATMKTSVTTAATAATPTAAAVTGAVGSVTGNVGGNVTGSVGSVATGGITAASIAADAITAAKIADGAIDAATFAAGAINAAAIAADAITDAKVASDVTIASVTGTVGSVFGLTASDVGAIKAKTDNLPSDPADASDIAALFAALPTAAQNAAALMDLSNGVETGLTPRQAFRLMAAALAGKLSGAATTTITIRNAVADSKDRITATVDSDGNRSAITVDLT